jgi:hypothetical protein
MKKGKFTFRTFLGSFLLAFGYIVPASAQTIEPAVERDTILMSPLYFESVGSGIAKEDENQKLWNELMKYKLWGTDSVVFAKPKFSIHETSGYTGTAKNQVIFFTETHSLGGPIVSGSNVLVLAGSASNDTLIDGLVRADSLILPEWYSASNTKLNATFCFKHQVFMGRINGRTDRGTKNNNGTIVYKDIGGLFISNTGRTTDNVNNFINNVHAAGGKVYADWDQDMDGVSGLAGLHLDGSYAKCPDRVPKPERDLTVPIFDATGVVWESPIQLVSTNNGSEIKYISVPPVTEDDMKQSPKKVWFDKFVEDIKIDSQTGKILYILMPTAQKNSEASNGSYKKTGRLTRIFSRDGFNFESAANDAKIQVAYVNDEATWNNDTKSWDNVDLSKIKVVADTNYAGNVLFYTTADVYWPAFKGTNGNNSAGASFQGTFMTTGNFTIYDHLSVAGQLIAGKTLWFESEFNGEFHYVPFNSPEIKTNVFSNDKFKESNDVWYDMDFYLTDTVHTEVSFDYCFAFFDEVTDADTKYAYYKTPDAGNRSEEFAKREDLAENPTDENDPHFMPFCKDGKKKHVVIKKNTRKPSEPFYIKVIEDSKQEGSEYMIFRIMNLNGATISGGVFDGGLVVRLVDDNKAPHFTGTKPSPLIVPENAKNENGKKVEAGQILAEDDDDDDVLFSVIDGSAKDLFEIDKKTGVVTMKDGVDAFDYEAWKASGDKYQIEVEICDDKFFQLCDSRMFEIVIGDVNEKPYFDYGTTDKKEIKIAENEYFSDENVKFADLDTYTNKNGDIIKNTSFTNDSVSAIGGDTDVFDVTKNGAVKTKPGVVLDYETKSTYKLTLRVQDATRDADGNLKYPDLYDEMEITVLVTDVDDGPKFEFKTYNGTVVENSIAPTEVNMDHAIHAETSQIGATITYSLLDDSKSFVIDPNTGVITVAAGAVLDYETKNVYEMKVVASDASGVAGQIMQTDTAAVIISLIDVNEMPVFVEPTTAFSFPENQKGYPIGTLTFDDLDTASGFRNNKFECLNCEDLGFYLDETTGELSTTRRFDYETEEKTYKLNIVIKDVDDATLSTTGSITVALTNVYEFTELVYTVLESDTVGTPFKKALEVDNTEGLSTTLKFSILDGSTEVDATKEFKLDSVTGKFSVASPLDYETTESYSVRVRAKDENGVYGDTTITINVIDVNEAPSIFVDTIYVRENQAVNDPFSTVKTDKDDPDTKNPDFRNNVYDNTDKGDVVKILPNGDAILMKPIDYETDSLYEITVRVTDKDDSKLTSTKNVIVKVIDVYEKSEVEITRVETKDSIYLNTNDTIFVNQDIVDIEWKQDEKPKSSTDSLKLGCNEVIKTFYDKTKNDPGADTVIICYSNAAPIVTISANGENVTAENIYTVVEKATKNDTAIYVNKVKNDIKVTVTDTASHVTKSFTVSLELDTVSVPSKDFKDVKNIAETEVTRNKKPASGITSIPENGDYVKNSYTETVNGLEVTVSYYTDNKGKDVKRPVITASGQKKDLAIIEVSYTTKIDGKDVTISYFADASTGERVTLNTGLTDSESVLSADGDDVVGSYKVTYNYEDKNGNTVEVSYYLDEKGKIAKNTEGNIGYNVSYTYVNKFGNSSKKTVFIVLDQKGPVVKIVSPSEDDVLTANFAEVKWTVNGVEQDTLRVQGLDNGVQTIVRVFRDKAGNESRDSVHVMVKNVKNIDINVEKPVTLVDRDSVEKFYKTKPPKKDQTYGVTFYNNKKKGETEAVVGIKGKAKDGSGEEPYPGLEGHLGPTLTVDARVPVVNALGGLATLDDIVSAGGLVALDGVDAANSRKVTVSEYVENYCTDEFKKSMKSDYSKMNLFWTTIRVKVWVYSNTGVFVDYYTFDYDLDDPDYVNDAGLLKFFFELKPDENGDVRTNDGRLYGTGAYLFKTEVKMTSKLRCDLPTSPEEEENVKASKKRNAVIRSSDELLKSFGYRRPVNN